jgi:hypothetical protein
VAIDELCRNRECHGPDFLRPFHFVMLALEAKRRKARQLLIPDAICGITRRECNFGRRQRLNHRVK